MTRLATASVLALSLLSASSALAQSYTAPAGIPAATAEVASQALPQVSDRSDDGAVYTTGSVAGRAVHHRRAVNR